MTTFSQANLDLSLPDSDGKPMADNTEQFRWIVMIKENLEVLIANDETVFIAGDLLWYPVPTRIIAPVAPDVMVVFGRPKGKRGSYRQWREENIPPQVVFEILSPSNNAEEMERKLEFYDTYRVEEYYLYDPDTFRFDGWHRQDGHLTKLWQLNGQISPRLGIRFETSQGELVIYRPDGQRFLTSIEMDQTSQRERQRAEQAESLLKRERQRSQQLEEYLRSIGVDPSDLP